MKYKSSKAVLYATVALSIIFINAAVASDAVVKDINYTGTDEQYNSLPDDKILAPAIDRSQSGNTITVSDPTPLGINFNAPSGVRGGYSSVSDVESNRVNILSGVVKGNVSGGSVIGIGNVKDNAVNISDGVIAGDVYGGNSSGFGLSEVTDNNVVISEGIIKGSVYGGRGEGAQIVKRNTVDISGGTIGGSIYGGDSYGYGAFIVTQNKVIISAGAIKGDVYGGRGTPFITKALLVTDNVIDISGGTITGNIYGGYGTFSVAGNHVMIAGVAKVENVYGGIGTGTGADGFSVAGNHVMIAGVAEIGNVYGGSSTVNASGAFTIANNHVAISGNANTGSVFGGYGSGTGTFNVTHNSVDISGGTITGSVSGGFGTGTGAFNVKDNRVKLLGGTITGDVAGGSGVSTGNGTFNIQDNSVVILGGTITRDVFGGSGRSSAAFVVKDNRVVISGDATTGNVYGGYGFSSGTSAFNITNNRVVILGGATNGDVHGGFGFGTSNITDNRVVILGGSITGSVYGGRGIGSGALSVTGNSAKISAGFIEGNVYGGYGALDNGSVTAINNTVTLEKNAIVKGAVYGGYALGPLAPVITEFNTVISGNTLNLNEYSGSVRGIYNFENYNWLLPKTVVNGAVLINITGNNAVNLDSTNHKFAMINDGTLLKAGDKIILIDRATGSPNEVPTQVQQIQQGLLIVYDVDVNVDSNGTFVLKVAEEAGITPRAKALLEGRAAALGFVSQGSDLIATAGIDNIRMMVRSKGEEFKGLPLTPFMITQGASNRYNTGSHADIDGFNMAMGLATGVELEQGNKVSLGTFFEYGRGTYNTYNSFTEYASVRGHGDTHYTGGGIFGRIDFAGTGLGHVANLTPTQVDGLYLEASLRAGRVSMSFGSDDLIDAEGYRGNYNSKVGYLGGHASAGYAFNFDEQQALDVYGRYLWTRMSGDAVTVGKDTLYFDKSISSRMQLGGRYSYVYSDQFRPYIGAAYEYEFAGDIGATAYGLRVDEPSFKGSTGIIEAGFSFTPDAAIPDLSINLNAQAFFGQRQGGSGEVKLKYQF